MDEDYEIARQFLVQIVPPEMSATINEILSQGNISGILNGEQAFMAACNWAPTGSEFNDKALAPNGMLLGFALGIGIKMFPGLKQDLKNFLEFQKKVRGENVFDFNEYRTKKLRSVPPMPNPPGGIS